MTVWGIALPDIFTTLAYLACGISGAICIIRDLLNKFDPDRNFYDGVSLAAGTLSLVSAAFVALSHGEYSGSVKPFLPSSPWWIGFGLYAIGFVAMLALGFVGSTIENIYSGIKAALSDVRRWCRSQWHSFEKRQNVRTEIRDQKKDHLLARFRAGVHKAERMLAPEDQEAFITASSNLEIMFESAIDLHGVLEKLLEGDTRSDAIDLAIARADRIFRDAKVREILGEYPDHVQADFEKLRTLRKRTRQAIEAMIFAAETLHVGCAMVRARRETQSMHNLHTAMHRLDMSLQETFFSESLKEFQSGAFQDSVAAALDVDPVSSPTTLPHAVPVEDAPAAHPAVKSIC